MTKRFRWQASYFLFRQKVAKDHYPCRGGFGNIVSPHLPSHLPIARRRELAHPRARTCASCSRDYPSRCGTVNGGFVASSPAILGFPRTATHLLQINGGIRYAAPALRVSRDRHRAANLLLIASPASRQLSCARALLLSGLVNALHSSKASGVWVRRASRCSLAFALPPAASTTAFVNSDMNLHK